MATWKEDIITALENLNGVAALSEIYEEVRRIRTNSKPQSFEAIIRRELEMHSSDSESYDGKDDIFFSAEGLGKGIWGLRSAVGQTPEAVDISLPEGNDQPDRREQKTYRILRDTVLARNIKSLHKNQCQICGETIRLPDGKRYSEAHHIKPLGRPHNGPDIRENIIVLCPNHHVMLDYGVIELKEEDLSELPNHKISREFFDYHNNNVLRDS